jgi:transcription elongation factor Elf1
VTSASAQGRGGAVAIRRDILYNTDQKGMQAMSEEKDEVLETQSAEGADIRDTDIVFDCPHCSKTLVIDYRGAGLQISCSECGKDVLVPIPDGMELTDLDMDLGEILKQLFATRRNYQKAESQVQKLKARLVSLQEALGAMQEVIAEGLASE